MTQVCKRNIHSWVHYNSSNWMDITPFRSFSVWCVVCGEVTCITAFFLVPQMVCLIPVVCAELMWSSCLFPGPSDYTSCTTSQTYVSWTPVLWLQRSARRLSEWDSSWELWSRLTLRCVFYVYVCMCVCLHVCVSACVLVTCCVLCRVYIWGICVCLCGVYVLWVSVG